MAKAEISRRYALIQDGHCHQKFDITTLPEWADTLQVVDITNLPVEPSEGDLHLGGTAFQKPAPPPPIPPRTVGGPLELQKALIRKGIVTQAEINAELS